MEFTVIISSPFLLPKITFCSFAIIDEEMAERPSFTACTKNWHFAIEIKCQFQQEDTIGFAAFTRARVRFPAWEYFLPPPVGLAYSDEPGETWVRFPVVGGTLGSISIVIVKKCAIVIRHWIKSSI